MHILKYFCIVFFHNTRLTNTFFTTLSMHILSLTSFYKLLSLSQFNLKGTYHYLFKNIFYVWSCYCMIIFKQFYNFVLRDIKIYSHLILHIYIYNLFMDMILYIILTFNYNIYNIYKTILNRSDDSSVVGDVDSIFLKKRHNNQI